MSSASPAPPSPASSKRRRLGIKAKLLGTSLILLAFTALIGVLGIHTASGVEHRSQATYDKVVVALQELGVARAKFNENRAFVNNHMLEPDAAAQKELEKHIAANGKLIDENLEALSPTLTTPEGKAALTTTLTPVTPPLERESSDEVGDVADSSAEVASAIQDLSVRSERIGGIADTITGIAEQTRPRR